MTRKSEREIERALEKMEERHGVTDNPEEIIIRDRVVDTGRSGDEGEDVVEASVVRETRMYRDDHGEWQTEQTEFDGSDRGDDPEK